MAPTILRIASEVGVKVNPEQVSLYSTVKALAATVLSQAVD